MSQKNKERTMTTKIVLVGAEEYNEKIDSVIERLREIEEALAGINGQLVKLDMAKLALLRICSN